MLKQRLLTGLAFALAAAGLIVFTRPEVMGVAVGLLILAAGREWGRLSGLQGLPARLAYLGALALALLLASALAGPGTPGLAPLLGGAAAFWCVATLAVLLYPRGARFWGGVGARLAIGFAVLVPPWVAVLYLRSLPHGEYLVLLGIALVAFVDIGAYFAGRAIGGPKLLPRVSPAKTWSGFCGGVSASLGLALAVALATGIADPGGWLAVCALTALVSVVGDLLESMLKRHGGIKDSGTLLPGHGGLFDRLDSLTAGLPVFALGVLLLGSPWR